MLPYDQLAAIRLGYGLPSRLTGADPAAVAASVAQAGMADDDAITLQLLRVWQDQGRRMRQAARGDRPATQQRLRVHQRRMRVLHSRAILARFARAVDDPVGFGERLVWFWADHFTVAGGSIYDNLMTHALVEDAIRPHLSGRFSDMLFMAETHAAMLRYLDQARAVGPNSAVAQANPDRALGLNENLAREMIELHSLGVGADYSQADVAQLAELLTGLTYDPRQPGIFRPARAEPGPEAVLGRSYGGPQARVGDIGAVIRDLAAHPDTARHLARKMAVHFVADDPPPALVDRLAASYADSGGNLGAMNLTLASAPELTQTFRAKLRQPFDYMVAALRALGLDGAAVRALPNAELQTRLLQPMAVMGQPWARPPGPDGWPEAAAVWASPQGLAMRINWAMTHAPALADPLPDARAFLGTALGDSAGEALAWAVPRAETQAEGVGLVLASAEFNRR